MIKKISFDEIVRSTKLICNDGSQYVRLFIKTVPVEKKIFQAHDEYAVLVVICVDIVARDDDFFEGILYFAQWAGFLTLFLLRGHVQRGLYVVARAASVYHKIHLSAFAGIKSAVCGFLIDIHRACVHLVAPTDEIVVDDVLHHVSRVFLAEIESGVA